MIALERSSQDLLDIILTSLAPCEGIAKFYHTILVLGKIYILGCQSRLNTWGTLNILPIEAYSLSGHINILYDL